MLDPGFRYDWLMWCRRAFLFVALVACTKSNPAKHCSDGTCSDPRFPFCDVTGAASGEAGTCITAACTADAFVECRGDVEVRCNVDGSNYNVSQCERGCEPDADGCRLCDPGETTCTNGKVATCDSAGAVVSAQTCPLGCFESEPRCREIDPSNDLATVFDMVPTPPSLTLELASINVDTGEITENGQPLSVSVPTFAVPAPAGGVPLRVFVVDTLTITQAQSFSNTPSQQRALVFLARGPISIIGKLASVTGSGDGLVACAAGDGVRSASCVYSASASGGGAFGTNGGKGGDVVNGTQQVVVPGGAGGIANGNDRLVPLRGGCPSGINRYSGAPNYPGAPGGGAIQLVSSVRITVSGVIDVAGAAAEGDADDPDQVGTLSAFLVSGGAGGGILLEAPEVVLATSASLDAKGGEGTGCTSTVQFNC
jgi:hypothetical protein